MCNIAIEEVVHPEPGHFRNFRDFVIYAHLAGEKVEEEPYGCGQKQLRFVLFPGVRLKIVEALRATWIGSDSRHSDNTNTYRWR